ncbi:MAG: DPP IV N-terminal domain-containing protein, partial [Paraglaciecola sp.]|nr:DPP IV N-terminal domain-containing protein [Paraglaciecola sp.]
MNKLTCLLLCGLSLMTSTSYSETLTIERIFSSPALEGAAPRSLKVSPDGKRVTFLQGKETDYERLDLWEYDLKTKKTQMLFNSDELSSGPEELSDEEKARRERMRLSGSGIVSYEWSKDGKALLFPLAGDLYYFKLGDKNAIQLLDTPEFETDFRLSPKGNYVSYVRNQDLYIKHIKNAVET